MTFPVVLVTILSGSWFVLLWRWCQRRWQRRPVAISPAQNTHPIIRQHLHLYRGGWVDLPASETLLEEIQSKLKVRDFAAIDRLLQGGLDYVLRIRALVEIGTPETTTILERQLSRQIAADPAEQTWYWVDVAHALRTCQRQECLPQLLFCSQMALTQPYGYWYAAEIIRFPAFADYLDYPLTAHGQIALKILQQVLWALRNRAIPVDLLQDISFREMIRRLVSACPGTADARVSRVFAEVIRSKQLLSLTIGNSAEFHHQHQLLQEQWNHYHLQEAEPIMREYLHGIGDDLVRLLPFVTNEEQEEILQALIDLRADVASTILPLLHDQQFCHRLPALTLLTWSRDPAAGQYLRARGQQIRQQLTARPWFANSVYSLQESHQIEELTVILAALRAFPDLETERLLLECSRSNLQVIREMALAGFGWWEPIQRSEVLNVLHVSRQLGAPSSRMITLGALARLGEVQALNLIREGLFSNISENVHAMIDLIAKGGITWMWPELDQLVDSTSDPTILLHAQDAIFHLREQVLGPLN